MALKFFWRCEGTTLDGTDDFTAGDNTATLNSAAAINTDAVRYGTNGLDSPSTQDYASFTISSQDLASLTLGSFGFAFRITSFLNGVIMFAATELATPNNHIRITMVGTDTDTGRELEFSIRRSGSGAATLTTTDANLLLNTWYHVIGRYDQPNNDRKLEVYDTNGTLITSVEDTSTAYNAPNAFDILQVGVVNGSGTIDVHTDNFFIGDVYAEPIEDNFDITSYTQYGATLDPIRLVWRQ